MKRYYNVLTSMSLSWRQTLSLRRFLQTLALHPRQKSVRPQANKRLPWQKTMRSSKPSSMVQTKMLRSFAKRVSKLNPPPSVQGLRDSLTLVNAAPYQSLSPTTVRRLGDGRQLRGPPSTCKTSSAVRSYVKQLWLPRGINSSLATYRRLNRECLHGYQITQICSTSSALGVTLTPRSALKCLTYQGLPKSLIQTCANLQSQRYSGAAMVLAGRPLRRSFLRGSLGLPQFATRGRSRKR